MSAMELVKNIHIKEKSKKLKQKAFFVETCRTTHACSDALGKAIKDEAISFPCITKKK